MLPILVLYATREGHTRRIADRLAGALMARGRAPQVVDAARLPDGFSLADYGAAIVCASVHIGKHEPEMVRFVQRHAGELHGMPSVFVSVSLSEAGAENVSSPLDRRSQAAADVERMIDEFLVQTGWHPGKIHAVAGALPYTRYNPLLRFVMKRIAAGAGGSTDTSRDHEFTNWPAVDGIAAEIAEAVAGRPAA